MRVTVCSDAMANCATCTSATACTTCQTGFYETAGSPDTCTGKCLFTPNVSGRVSVNICIKAWKTLMIFTWTTNTKDHW